MSDPHSHDHSGDSQLPDPMELFERMQREEEERNSSASSPIDEVSTSSDNALPDPAELFRMMQLEEEEFEEDDPEEGDPEEGDPEEGDPEEGPSVSLSLPKPGEFFGSTPRTIREKPGSLFADDDDIPEASVQPEGVPEDEVSAWEAGFSRESEEEFELDLGLPDRPHPSIEELAQEVAAVADVEAEDRPIRESDTDGDFDFPESEIASLTDYQFFDADLGDDSPLEDLASADLPDPAELFRRMRAEQEPPEEEVPSTDLPLVAADIEPPADDSALPRIPSPSDPPVRAPEPEADESIGFFQRMKSRFQKPSRSDDIEERPTQPELLLPFSQEPQEALDQERALPTPEELFLQLNRERESKADRSESSLPTPEEMFQRIQEERSEAVAEGVDLPPLPDLEAFKRQLEEEERARLDPDLLCDLSGPQRFVETVSDTVFSGGLQPSFLAGIGEAIGPGEDFEDDSEDDSEFVLEAVPERVVEPELQPAYEEEPQMVTPAKPERAPEETVSGSSPADDLKRSELFGVEDTAAKESQEEVHSSWQAGQETEAVKYRRRHPDDPILKKPSAKSKEASDAEDSKKKDLTFKRFSRYKLAILTRQLAVMLKSGIQLHASISFAAESDPTLQPMLESIVHKLESGYTFSGALASASRTFDPIYLGLAQAGELSGRLPEMLDRLADALEREVEMRKRIVSTVTYPAMLFMVCLLGTLGFIYFVLPTLTPLFDELQVNLPWPTQVLLASRGFILPTVAVSVLSAILLYITRDKIGDFIKARPILERRLSSIPFNLPVIGEVYHKVVTARVLYSLSTMLEVGITLNQSLARAETTAGNALTAHRLSRARMDLADGVGVTDCFRFNELFTPSALHLISAGEESARLAEMFHFVAKILDEEVEYALQSASSILEPLIMLFMGMVVGFITLAAALPTIQLLQNFT